MLGKYSWPGSSSCTITITDVGGGNIFRLQEQRDLYFLTYLAAYAVTAPGDKTNLYQQFTYDTTTLQIRNPTSGWCLDDHGGEAQGLDNRNEIVSFAPCDPTSINQQFIYSNLRIFNPNWPNSNLVLNRAGSTVTVSGTTLNQIMLWNSDAVNPDEDFVVFIICGPGQYSQTQASGSCLSCPAGTYSSSEGTIGSCSNCPAGELLTLSYLLLSV